MYAMHCASTSTNHRNFNKNSWLVCSAATISQNTTVISQIVSNQAKKFPLNYKNCAKRPTFISHINLKQQKQHETKAKY